MKTKQIATLVIVFIVIGVVSSIGTYYLTQPPPPKKLDKVILALGWVVLGYDAPWFVALDQGFYEDNGISITIVRGYGSVDTVRRVDQGAATFGMNSYGAINVLRSEGIKVKGIGVIYHNNPLVIFSRQSTGITEPKDLEGHTVAGAPGAEHTMLFPAFCEKYGVDLDKIEWVNLEPALHYSALASGTVDALSSMIPTNTIRGVVQGAGDDINVIWWDIPLYGYTLNARDDLIENNPDLVQRFVDATYKGIDWAMENPEGAIDILLKYNPEIPRDVGLESLIEIFDTMYKPNASGKDLGVFDPQRVQSGWDVVKELYGIDVEIPLDDLYTNQFVSS